ncbi:unnamed protein product [Penicillium olsonii]|nr:unnamed protein product [Penicillium olsonii]
MDMEMNGTPWLDQPVALHSSRFDNCTLSEAQCQYRNYSWRYWYEADHVYALNTVYFLCAVIGVFTIANVLVRISPDAVKRTPPWRMFTSVSRYFSYRGHRLPALRYWSPALGVVILGLVGAAFFFGMVLGPQPYYWPTDASYGANMISGLTGIPHEKLQVFHHWTSYAMFVLALVHTFPYIIYHIWKGDMMHQWKTSIAYWTGIASLVSQTYLTLMSLPFIRNRFYEFFKATHIFVAVVFVVFFFLHCDFRLSSWDYFIASGAIYFCSLIAGHARTYWKHGMHTASLELLPCGLVRVEVASNMKWTPGQHVFVRFLTSDLHLLTAHPFTISSACHETSKLVFYIKPRGGVTGRLRAMAEKSPGCKKRILMEGPYGGVSESHMAQFDTVLVIAGGSGGGFSLAMVDEALRVTGMADEEKKKRQNLQVVFSTRDHAMADWYIEEIEGRLSESTTLASESGFETAVSVHVTDPRSSGFSSGSEDDVKGTKSPQETTTTGTFSLNVHRNARPDLPGLVARTVALAHTQGQHVGKKQRVGVLVCGPASMLHDTRNAAAVAQNRVFGGEIEELYLHSEAFAW